MMFTLPIPVSLNKLYANNNTKGQRGRHKVKSGKKWDVDAARMIPHQFKQIATRKSHTKDTRYQAHYTYHFADKKLRDIANYEKAISDILTKMGVIREDSQIDRMFLERGNPSKDMPHVHIHISILD